LEAIALTPESRKNAYGKMNYIVTRCKNKKVPMIPMNFFVETEDDDMAKEFSRIMGNAMRYNQYLDDNFSINEIDFAQTMVEDFVKKYSSLEGTAFFHLHHIDLLEVSGEHAKVTKAAIHQWLSWIDKNPKKTCTFICGQKNHIRALVSLVPELAKEFKETIVIGDCASGKIADDVIDMLKGACTVPDSVKKNIYAFVDADYAGSFLRSKDYVNDLFEKIIFNHYKDDFNADDVISEKDIPKLPMVREEKEIFADINSMVGLNEIKEVLMTIKSQVAFDAKRGKRSATGMHMIFSGNPGTGKTTVARFMAEILYNIGYIKQNKLVMCTAKDLIAEYYGQTASQTARKCEEAYDGVLFIDEAYQLNPKSSGQMGKYEEEAIAQLITQMEDNRDRLVIIFAGYSDEMARLLSDANPGLRSRISRIIEFPDYSEEELLVIFKNILAKEELTIEEEALTVVKDTIHAHINDKNFGNARFVRELFSTILSYHAGRVSELDVEDEQFLSLSVQDVVCSLKYV